MVTAYTKTRQPLTRPKSFLHSQYNRNSRTTFEQQLLTKYLSIHTSLQCSATYLTHPSRVIVQNPHLDVIETFQILSRFS